MNMKCLVSTAILGVLASSVADAQLPSVHTGGSISIYASFPTGPTTISFDANDNLFVGNSNSPGLPNVPASVWVVDAIDSSVSTCAMIDDPDAVYVDRNARLSVPGALLVGGLINPTNTGQIVRVLPTCGGAAQRVSGGCVHNVMMFAEDALGNLYISNATSRTICRWNGTSWSQFLPAFATDPFMAIDGTDIYVSVSGVVRRYSTSGSLLDPNFAVGNVVAVGPVGSDFEGIIVGRPDSLIAINTATMIETPILTGQGSTGFVAFDSAGDLYVSQGSLMRVLHVTQAPQAAPVSGLVLTSCPTLTPLHGVTVDLYEIGSGDLAGSAVSESDGSYEIPDISPGDYVVTVVTPLGYTTPSPEIPVHVAGAAVNMDIQLGCLPIADDAHGIGFWKHQVSVATGGKGHAQIDGASLCGYLDLIEAHFNSNAINQVIVYDPPANAVCADKLLVAKELLNLKGNVGMTARAKQHLMSLLLNVAGNYVSLRKVVSTDGATVSQAVTYCDHLIDDANLANDELAKDIAEQVNEGIEINAGIIPSSTDDVAYAPIRPDQPAAAFGIEGAHPNPFNPQATIVYSIASQGPVRMRIYDVRGTLIRTLIDEDQAVGQRTVTWDGVDSDNRSASSGIYFVRLESGGKVETRKIALLK